MVGLQSIQITQNYFNLPFVTELGEFDETVRFAFIWGNRV